MEFQAILNRKEPELKPDRCTIDSVVELTKAEFEEFCKFPLKDYGFISEYAETLTRDEHGVNHGILVLGEEREEGVFVVSEGYSYARYLTHIPNARTMAAQDRYPALSHYCDKMWEMVDQYAARAIEACSEKPYRIDASILNRESHELVCQMLESHQEIEKAEVSANQIQIRLDPCIIQKEREEYRELTQEEVNVICAKHTLWLYDDGGEQANLSGCLLRELDLSHCRLNGAVLDGAKFLSCNMEGLQVCCASCEGMRAVECMAEDMTAEESNFCRAEFIDCNLKDGFFTHSDLTGASFTNCQMEKASLQNCCLKDIMTTGTSTEKVNMRGVCYDEETFFEESGRKREPIARISFINGEIMEYTDKDEFLSALHEELPYRQTTGMNYEILADDPALRKAVDDEIFHLFGEDNPSKIEDYQKNSSVKQSGMQMM